MSDPNQHPAIVCAFMLGIGLLTWLPFVLIYVLFCR